MEGKEGGRNDGRGMGIGGEERMDRMGKEGWKGEVGMERGRKNGREKGRTEG